MDRQSEPRFNRPVGENKIFYLTEIEDIDKVVLRNLVGVECSEEPPPHKDDF
jgi:hypothetical protein